MRLLCLATGAFLAFSACKAEVGVKAAEAEDKIKKTFLAKGLALREVTCPEGRLKGEVECVGKTAGGVEVPVVLNIEKGKFLSSKLSFETRGVAVGFVISEQVAASSQEKYGVKLEVQCPQVTPENEAAICRGTFDGADVVVEYVAGKWNTKSGVIGADNLEKALADTARERGLNVDPATIDCGPQRMYGAVDGRKYPCKAGNETVTFQMVRGRFVVVSSEPAPPQPAK